MLFKSTFLNLSVYHEDKPLQFRNGLYETTDKNEIKVLKHIKDVEEFKEEKTIEK